MSNRIARYIILLLFLVILHSCDENTNAPAYQKEISVFGFLWGGQPLRKENGILITHTKPITDYYDPAQAAIMNASVIIREVESGALYNLYPAAEYPGYFYNDSLIVKPRKTYHLQIKVDDEIVTATTTVPPQLEITADLRTDTTNYFYPNADSVPPIYLGCEDENQLIYIDMFCNQTFSTAEYIKPFNAEHRYPESQEEYDGGRNGPPRHIWAFMRFQDLMAPAYQYRHVIYWYRAMFVFYGSNTMQVLAIDENYHRFLYSEHPERSSGVNGGIGVFGSVAGAKFEFIVAKS